MWWKMCSGMLGDVKMPLLIQHRDCSGSNPNHSAGQRLDMLSYLYFNIELVYPNLLSRQCLGNLDG